MTTARDIIRDFAFELRDEAQTRPVSDEEIEEKLDELILEINQRVIG